jgi:hypothetical protein
MNTENTASAPFNEQAALEELERLQRAIEESRRQRGQTVAEFDDFVRSFSKASRGAAETQRSRVPAPAPRPLETVVAAAGVPAVAAPVGVPQLPTPLFDDEEDAQKAATAPKPSARKPFPRPIGVIGGGILVVAVGSLLVMRSRPSPPAPAPAAVAPASAANAPAAPPSAPREAATTPAAPAVVGVPNGPFQAELTALRTVWVRVLVDGQKVVERELKGNEHVPIRAAETIAIRAGDAGAVRFAIAGQDQGSLGRDGIVVTRTFSAKTARQPQR